MIYSLIYSRTNIITRLIEIDIAPLTVLFCYCPLAHLQLPTVKRY